MILRTGMAIRCMQPWMLKALSQGFPYSVPAYSSRKFLYSNLKVPLSLSFLALGRFVYL